MSHHGWARAAAATFSGRVQKPRPLHGADREAEQNGGRAGRQTDQGRQQPDDVLAPF